MNVELLPNNNQYACAVAALWDDRKPRSFINVPSGMGKSRVIAALIALKNEYDDTQHFTVVFTTELLKSVENDKYIKLERFLSCRIELVVYNSKLPLAGQVNPESFTCIDEADQVLLDNAAVLPNKHVVGLSATPCSPDKPAEMQFLLRNGFVCIDSKINGSIDPNTATDRASIA